MISRLIGKNLEIDHGARISSYNSQYLPGHHISEGFLGAEYGQGADKAAHVQFLIPIPVHAPPWSTRGFTT